ncbi:MAG: DUF488 domain-containing protein [Chloroflexi bacterium]|nr:DUF488 domain-containing protein [Chloroflexota bacterium]
MPRLYTLGYEGRSLSEFIRLLQEAGVDAIIDIRLRNTSHLAGYTKKDDLAFLLQEGFHIAYEHHPELAPTVEILDAYRAEKDWSAYVESFTRLLEERQTETIGLHLLTCYQAPCLLCREASPEQCHRRLTAERWAARIPGLTIVHL